MNYWRMAMRDDSHGPDMFGPCKLRGIAAITYDVVKDLDLSPFDRKNKPAVWRPQPKFSPGSMSQFAFDIEVGDLIFVKDSKNKMIVGCGRVDGGPIGSRAYRFEQANPVVTPSGYPWRHYVNVTWLEDFKPIPHVARAPLITVLKLNDDEVAEFSAGLAFTVPGEPSFENKMAEGLLESRYTRRSPEQLAEIIPQHKILSNRFAEWVRALGAKNIRQEAQFLDCVFQLGDTTVMAEHKVCYGQNTASAIREALGQIFEYNLHGKRRRHDKWLLVLDTPPFEEDITFIRRIRADHVAPIFLGWKSGDSNFIFEKNWH